MNRFRHRPTPGRRAPAVPPAAAVARAAVVGLAAALALTAAAPASAHILNEKSQFADIEFVEARLDIVMLAGAGVIPQTPVFLPEDPLSSRDLAAWAALAHGLAEGGETPDVDALAEAALSQGLVESLDGQATYADINRLLFEGAAALPEDLASAVPIRADAAAFVARHLFEAAGRVLLERLDLRPGPTGFVDAVRVNEVPPGDQRAPRYGFVFGETVYNVDVHGRVGNGPADLLQWEGLYVVRSLLKGAGDEVVLVYVEAGEPGEAPAAPAPGGEPADTPAGDEGDEPEPGGGPGGEDAPAASTTGGAPEEGAAEPSATTDVSGGADAGTGGAAGSGLPVWFWVLPAAIAALGVFLFAGGRRRS